MEERHKKAIRANYVSLSQTLSFTLVMPSLIQDGIYEPFMTGTFQAQGGMMDINQALLNSIETRGPKAFDAFLRALNTAGQGFLADAIQAKIHSPPGGSNEKENFVSHETDAGSIWPKYNTPAVFEQYRIHNATFKAEMVDSSEVYRMVSKPRGLALIINNKHFRTMPERSGTEVDGRNLVHVFTELGFYVETKPNLTSEEMISCITKLVKMDHSKYDCVILAILSHGEEGALYGIDEKTIAVEDIINYFDGTHAKSLNGKPKLIFLQACRGGRFDPGTESTDGPDAGRIEQTMHTTMGDADQDPEALSMSMLQHELDEVDAFVSTRSKVPLRSDMLIAYATVPGYVSWRNSKKGSWFIQAFTEVILEYSHTEDLLSMLTKVNAKVAKAFESSAGRNKQMPAPVTMLTKKLFFFPGYVRQ